MGELIIMALATIGVAFVVLFFVACIIGGIIFGAAVLALIITVPYQIARKIFGF